MRLKRGIRGELEQIAASRELKLADVVREAVRDYVSSYRSTAFARRSGQPEVAQAQPQDQQEGAR